MKMPVINHRIDPMHPFHPSVTGTICETVRVGDKDRTFITYVPSDVRSATAGIIVFPDNGVSALEMYEKSNWIELSETDERKEKFIVFFLDQSSEGWNIENPEEDLLYIQEMLKASKTRNKFDVHESKNYLVGYGVGGTMAHMAAMDDPAIYAGIATVNAPDISAEYEAKTAEAPCTSLDLYEDPENIYGYKKKDFLVPAWVITSEEVSVTARSTTVSHWRESAGTCETPRQLRPDVWEYYRTEPAPWTVNQEKEAFRVWVSQIEDADKDYGRKINRRLWAEFLRGVRRWAAEPGGDLRMTKDPVIDLGMEYHYEEIDGWMREYYIYVPTYMRNGYEKEVPLVFALHGYTCSGEIYSSNSDWFKVAEDNGIIVVFPSAVHGIVRSDDPDNPAVGPDSTELPAWNIMDMSPVGPDEIHFFDILYEKVCSTYKINRQRVYVTGHSLGSLMTQLLGMARPNLYAAIAPCSGVLFMNTTETYPKKPEVVGRPDLQLPIWMFGGENEPWLMPSVPTPDNISGETIYVWWDLNKMSAEKPQIFETFRATDNGRWNDYIFPEGEIPMIRYTWVSEMPHATMTEMSYRIWNEFFSKIQRSENGEIELI